VAELILNVSLNDQATAGLKEIDKKVAELGGKETKLRVGVDTTGVTQGARTVHNALAQTEGTIGKISISLANMLKIKAFQAITSEIRSSLTEMKAVDDELVTVRKVANATDAELKSLNDRAYNVGSQYGMKASDYLSAVADFTRAGYKELAGDLGELAVKTQLVGDVSQNVATQMLLSVDTAYQYQGSVEKLSAVLDGMNEIDNNFATSIGKISTGLGKIAPIAAQAHVGVDELSAAIGTITAVTQRSGEEAATALRALFLNIIGDTKTEIADGATWTAGEIEGLHDVLVKYAPAAVEAAKATGDVINPMEAIGGLAQSMKDGLLTEQELMSMVSDIGGKLRTSQLLAIIQNWDMYKDMLTSFGAAAGSADKEVSNAMDSWTRKSEILSNSVTKLMNDLLDTKVIKGGLDGLTSIVNLLDTAGGKAVLQGAAVATGLTAIAKAIDMIGTAFSRLKGLGTFGWIGAAVAGISLLVAGYNELFPSLDKLNDLAAQAQKNYDTEKGKLEDINSELATTVERINELEGQGTLTLVEQAELDKLKEVTKELLLQQSIQEWKTENAQKEAALAQAQVAEKYEYADEGSVNEHAKNLREYLSSIRETEGEFAAAEALISDATSKSDQQIGQLTADYRVLNEYVQRYSHLAKDAANAGDYDSAEVYQDYANRFRQESENIEGRLKEQIEILETGKKALQDSYDSIAKAHTDSNGDLDFTTMTDDEKKIVAAWQMFAYSSLHLQDALGLTQQYNAEMSDAAQRSNEYAKNIEAARQRIALLNTALGELTANQKISDETQKKLNDTFGEGAIAMEDMGDGWWASAEDLKKRLNEEEKYLEEHQELKKQADEEISPDFDTSGVDAFTSSLNEAKSALSDLLKEMNSQGESGDLFRDIQGMYKSGMGKYSEGKVNTNQFKTMADYLIDPSKKSELGYDYEAYGEFLSGKLASGLLNAKDGAEAADFLAKNFSEIKDAGGNVVATFKKVGDGVKITADDLGKLAEATGLSETFWRALMGEMAEYDPKSTVEGNKTAETSFKDLANAVSTTENGVKKVKFTDYAKEAAKAGKSVKEIQDDIAKLGKEDSGFKLEMDVDSADAESTIQKFVEEAQAANDTTINPTATLNDQASGPLATISGQMDALDGRTVTVNVIANVKGGGLPATFFSAAHAAGTDDADAGPTLVNELGPELIAQDGKAFIAGGGKPTIVNLKKGAIVYNHLETEALLQGQKMGEEGIASKAAGSVIGSAKRSNWGTSITVPSGPKLNGKGGGGKGSGKASSSEEEEETPDWWKIVEDYYKRATDEANRAIDRLDYRLELIKNDWDDLKEPLDKEVDALDRANDQLDRQATLLERERDKLTKPLNDQIDAMEKAKDIQDEQLELAEKQKAVEEARNELQNAQNERTIRYFNTQKGQWEWMADKGRVKDAQDALADAEKDLADFQYDMQIKALERQVDEIEGAYQKQLDAIEEQQTANEDRIYELEQQLQALEDYYEAAMEPLEKQQKELERKLAAIEEQWAEAEMPYTKPEGNLSDALNNIGGSGEENQAVRDIVSKAQGNAGDSLSQTKTGETTAPFTKEAAKAIQEALYREYGIQFGAFDSSNASSTQTVTQAQNNIVNNNGTTLVVNGITISGDFKTMTISDLISDLGIYAGQ
jgi:TP901 family phage tail tape measure protein